MSLPTEALSDRLVRRVPGLHGMLEEHRQDYRDQAPRAFLRTIAFILTARYLSGDQQAIRQLRDACAFLDEEFGVDAEIDVLIAGSFLPALPTPEDPRAKALDLLGPKLSAELGRQRRGEGIAVPRPTETFVRRMVERVPPLAAMLRDQIDFSGEILPHIFFGDLTRQIVAWFLAGGADLQHVHAVLDVLEAEFGADFEIDELIAVSFVEDLPYPDEPGGDISEILPPTLRAELDNQRGARG